MKKDILEYKEYIAELHLDVQDKIIIGQVINTKDIISFHGNTIKEAEQAFHNVLDTYIDSCKQEKISPSRSYSGKFNLRIPTKLHRDLSISATKSNMSLNEYTENLIIKGLEKEFRPNR